MYGPFTFTALALAASLSATPVLASASFESIVKLWSTSSTGIAGVSGNPVSLALDFSSEISAWDPISRSIFVAGGRGIEVLGLTGSVINSWDTTTYGEINSIAISDGVAAVSFANSANKGLLVANEGKRQINGTIHGEGSVSIISVGSTAPASFSVDTVNTLGFTAWNGQETALRTAGVRIQAGISTSIALEPEYIAVSQGGLQAKVTLQENNAVALIDLATNQITGIKSMGTKDFSLSANHIDPSDQDSPGTGVEGAMTEIVSLDGRSFSIRDNAGNLVWDSGNDLETRAIAAGLYDDLRSDDKGVEPEGVTIFSAIGRTFAAIGLERPTRSAIAIYDVTNPTAPTFAG